MNCPTCGATLTDGTTTCPTCGASISQPADFNQMQYQQPQANYNQQPYQQPQANFNQAQYQQPQANTIIRHSISSLRQISIRCHMQILLAQDSSGNSMPDILQ